MTFEIKGIDEKIVSVITYVCWVVEEEREVLITEYQKIELLSKGHVFK
tara:strand:- start:2797 stop:2940 length:144 start_codon:yes stop_codon:yes gene_type:complete